MKYRYTDLGQKIRECRLGMNINQTELAEILREKYGLKTTRETVTKWETGFQEPSITPIKYMAEIFGVSIDFLNEPDEKDDRSVLSAPDLSTNQKWLMDRIVKADPAKADKLRKLMELIDGEDQFN